jgi:histidine triad (HIT) family protein
MTNPNAVNHLAHQSTAHDDLRTVREMVQPGCVFCAIATGETIASVVHCDEHIVAFMDIRPFTPGHLLVIPRRHSMGLADLDPQDGARLFQEAQRLAGALRRSDLPCEGVNLFLADGIAAGQEVFHVHLHVVPRTQGDGIRLHANWRFPPRTELDQHAAMLRSLSDS